MIVYGKNVFETLQDQPDQIKEIYIQSGLRDEKIQKLLTKLPSNIRLKTVTRKDLDKLTNRGVHNGVAAKVKDLPTMDISDLARQALKKKDKPLLIALDEIQDPHNVGAILRSADAAGADGVILCKHNSAGLTPAAVKTSAGAAYSMPVASVSSLSNGLKQLKDLGYWIAGTDFDASSVDYRKPDYDSPLVLVIGNEGKGMSSAVKKQCDFKVHLPMNGSVQSLNASVAAGILMYEIQNRRENH